MFLIIIIISILNINNLFAGNVTVRPSSLAPYHTAVTGGISDISDGNDATSMTLRSAGGGGDNGDICGIDSFTSPGITGKEIYNITIYFRYRTDNKYKGKTYWNVRYSTSEPETFFQSDWIQTNIPNTNAQTALITTSTLLDISRINWENISNLDIGFMNSDGGTADNFYIHDIWITVIYDDIPPSAITGISANPGFYGSEVNLVWFSPGDDGWDNIISTGYYRIDYSTWNKVWSSDIYQIEIATHNVIPGSLQSKTITGLIENLTYYFRIWTVDDSQNVSSISTGVTSWIMWEAPSTVTDLQAISEIDGSVKLIWTSPGDNGKTGPLEPGSEFRIQYSTYTEVIWNFNSAQVVISTYGVIPGEILNYSISGLTGGLTYYFKLWTSDEIGNISDISNTATAQVEKVVGVWIDLTEYNFGTFTVCSTQAVSDIPLKVKNIGNVSVDFSIKLSTPDIWNFHTNFPGSDIFVLQSIFNSTIPSTPSFIPELHALTTDYIKAGTSGGNFAGDETGNSVPASEERYLWYFLKTPLQTSTTREQIIGIHINAEEHQ